MPKAPVTPLERVLAEVRDSEIEDRARASQFGSSYHLGLFTSALGSINALAAQAESS